MATPKHAKTARRNVGQAREAASSEPTTAHTPKRTQAEPYELAKQRDLPGRAKMVLDELARKLGYK